MKIREGSHTPWGPAQAVTELADGITFVSTAGHGGVYLAPDRANEMPKELVEASFLGLDCWFEEDCDWCLPYVVFEKTIESGSCPAASQLIAQGVHRQSFERFAAREGVKWRPADW